VVLVEGRVVIIGLPRGTAVLELLLDVCTENDESAFDLVVTHDHVVGLG